MSVGRANGWAWLTEAEWHRERERERGIQLNLRAERSSSVAGSIYLAIAGEKERNNARK